VAISADGFLGFCGVDVSGARRSGADNSWRGRRPGIER